MAHRRRKTGGSSEVTRWFEAEAAYAESIFREAIGDTKASIAAAERALSIKPDYPPAVLTMGSIEYQRGREDEGARLFSSLLSLPDESGDLWEVIDKAGDFLIQEQRYAEGLEFYEAALRRFPDRESLYQGLGCCAGHEGLFDMAVEASRKALDLEPNRADLMSDLGWSLYEAGRLEEAEKVLSEAVALDSSDERARGNLRLCQAARESRG
jgi:tetratricopeptide (TPR) repeat protein